MALSLPHWEFESYMRGFSKLDAREILSMTQSIGLAFGGKESKKAMQKLQIAAGYKKPGKAKIKKEKNPAISWTRQLFIDAFSE